MIYEISKSANGGHILTVPIRGGKFFRFAAATIEDAFKFVRGLEDYLSTQGKDFSPRRGPGRPRKTEAVIKTATRRRIAFHRNKKGRKAS